MIMSYTFKASRETLFAISGQIAKFPYYFPKIDLFSISYGLTIDLKQLKTRNKDTKN